MSDMDHEPFRLSSTPAPWTEPMLAENTERESDRQLRMFAGMDCLPGQLDLFHTDGESEPQP